MDLLSRSDTLLSNLYIKFYYKNCSPEKIGQLWNLFPNIVLNSYPKPINL